MSDRKERQKNGARETLLEAERAEAEHYYEENRVGQAVQERYTHIFVTSRLHRLVVSNVANLENLSPLDALPLFEQLIWSESSQI